MMLRIAFRLASQRGFHQMSGSARGPTQRNAMTTLDVLKYHLPLVGALGASGVSGGNAGWRVAPSRNSPQCLHLMAAFWISSAQ